MINITDKHKCCGCEACVQVCPKHCISLISDDEGFLYPKIDDKTCIGCNLCEKVCPVINIRKQDKPVSVWAAQNNNERIRFDSSSGGIATLFEEKVIEQGGVVFGAKMNEKCEVVHSYVETKEQLYLFRGSKYVQSKIGDTFKQVEDFLKKGRIVLFIGTPCQVSGLKSFLRKEYENLYTIDFICHGVPSPWVFKWFLQEEIDKFMSKLTAIDNTIPSHRDIPNVNDNYVKVPDGIHINNIRFRDKRNGWKNYGFVIDVNVYIHGKHNTFSLYSNVRENAFLRGFCLDLYLRPSCHKCPSRNFRSGSDITIADFWGQEYMFPEFDHDTGVSSILIKTTKGNQLFMSLENLKKEKKSIDQVLRYNQSLVYSTPERIYRRKFWENIGKYSFEDTVKHAMRLNLIERVIVKIKSKLS